MTQNSGVLEAFDVGYLLDICLDIFGYLSDISFGYPNVFDCFWISLDAFGLLSTCHGMSDSSGGPITSVGLYRMAPWRCLLFGALGRQ